MGYNVIVPFIPVQCLAPAESSACVPASCLVVFFLITTQEKHCGTYISSHIVGYNAPESHQINDLWYSLENSYLHTKYLREREQCKGCDPCGQLLCEDASGAQYCANLHTHSKAAYGRKTGAYNTPVATQWLGQRLCYSLVQLIGYGYSIKNSFETLLKAYQVLLAHIVLVNLHQTPPKLH